MEKLVLRSGLTITCGGLRTPKTVLKAPCTIRGTRMKALLRLRLSTRKPETSMPLASGRRPPFPRHRSRLLASSADTGTWRTWLPPSWFTMSIPPLANPWPLLTLRGPHPRLTPLKGQKPWCPSDSANSGSIRNLACASDPTVV